MPALVKICGLTSAEAADAALRAGAAYGGLVFHPASPRFLAPEQARMIADAVRGKLRLVALVADASDAALQAMIAQVRPDMLQLHGTEDETRTAEIRARFGLPVIKALGIAEAEDLARAQKFEAVADMLLFDARPPKGAARAGGHGTAFDWTLLKDRSFGKPWFLAGGLDPDNVARALAASGASMVDVSSGVESAPGVKSVARIAEFFAATKEPVQA